MSYGVWVTRERIRRRGREREWWEAKMMKNHTKSNSNINKLVSCHLSLHKTRLFRGRYIICYPTFNTDYHRLTSAHSQSYICGVYYSKRKGHFPFSGDRSPFPLTFAIVHLRPNHILGDMVSERSVYATFQANILALKHKTHFTIWKLVSVINENTFQTLICKTGLA